MASTPTAGGRDVVPVTAPPSALLPPPSEQNCVSTEPGTRAVGEGREQEVYLKENPVKQKDQRLNVKEPGLSGARSALAETRHSNSTGRARPAGSTKPESAWRDSQNAGGREPPF